MLDIDNGARFETYAIEGEAGQICLNGAAEPRLVAPGDKVILITYRGVRASRVLRPTCPGWSMSTVAIG